jgi:CheY-like chemotaxis protein
MLEQVLVNLTVNARDAMPAGGVLTIETTAVELDTASAARIAGGRSGRYARLTVTDTGTGIPPDIMPRIFDPFFTTKGPDRGTGLGLATVFGIVKEHGGWCSVSSELGRGSRFEVLIPLHDSDAATRKPPEVQSRGGCETILLVEDEPQLRDGTKRMLERYGYRVFEADSGDAALQLWPNIRGQVTLLLTDVVMAGSLNGDELATRLRGDQPNLRVVLMSGYSAEDISSGTRARGDTFLEKPVARDELLGALRSALDGGQYR